MHKIKLFFLYSFWEILGFLHTFLSKIFKDSSKPGYFPILYDQKFQADRLNYNLLSNKSYVSASASVPQ